ncbi:MAG TPA: hypothetical protein VMB81_31210 [Candidatus Sulfotelmatobacter sp.]|nr:hypothetical protein [Candidatus Sulfotelmatobacter sp.]
MRKTILVIEGDRGRRKALVSLLSGAGYDVIAGEDVAAARHMVDRFDVDVMISDLQLPAAALAAPAARSARRRAAKPPPKRLIVSRVPVPDGASGDRPAPDGTDILPPPLERAALLDKVRALLA